MKTTFPFWISLVVTLGLLFTGCRRSKPGPAPGPANEPEVARPVAKGIEGYWLGTLKVPSPPSGLRLGVRVSKKPDGTFTGTFDSLDQGAKGLPIDEITFTDGTLRFTMKNISASFEGKMNEAGSEIAGQWKQGVAVLPLAYQRQDKQPEDKRPQEPKKPYPYVEEEVAYENPKARIKIAGTLTLPRTEGPFPAVLLIAGSGPNNRDETVFGHKPFLVLADYLTRRGIAVLRVDKRGIGASTGNYAQATSVEFADDVLSGVQYLKRRKEIDPTKIGLVGHSEGGIVAPMAATQSNDVAFIVLMAGSALTGEEILYLQGAAILKAAGATEKQRALQRAIQERSFAVVRKEKDDAMAAMKISEVFAEEMAKLNEGEKKALGDLQDRAQGQGKVLVSPWYRFFLAYDPRPTLAKVRCPLLAINGEKDTQVDAKENLKAIETALREGGNKDYMIQELPNLNHLFQTCRTGGLAEYSLIEETIAPSALPLVGDWILQHTTGPGKAAN